MSGGIEFRILGPFDITRDGAPVPVAATKHRVLLARLLADANQVVPVARLVECLWDNDPPVTARAVVHTYVSRLRQALGSAELIETLPNGYRAVVRDDQLDLLRFRSLVRLSRQARDPVAESALLREAAELWRGPALATVPSDALHADATRLDHEEMAAADRRVELDLSLGRHHDLVPQLRAMVARRPFSERPLGQLMLALHRSGRQADALSAYQEFRAALGAEPGVELRELHQAILRGEDESPAPPTPSTSDWTPVSQLPPRVGDFVGRSDELATISGLLRRRGSLTAPLVVLSGPPGVGKTALAVHAAHELKPDFPDGQLYVNLRGYSPEPALTAAQVLPQFLRALGVPPEQVPLAEPEQASLYRTLLSGRRILVVLDNASAAEQARALAPSSTSCATVVTSRNTLGELVSSTGAQLVPVDVLAREPALLLLERIIGPGGSPEAADTLVDLCGALPLALRIAAANIAFSVDRDLHNYLEQLRSKSRLSSLSIDGDRDAAVRSSFELSYQQLKPETRRVFRLLGSMLDTSFTSYSTAALAKISIQAAERELNLLHSANLIEKSPIEHYHLHDLIHLYAHEKCIKNEQRDAIKQAHSGLIGYYLRQIQEANLAIDLPLGLTTADYTGPCENLSEASQALYWINNNLENLLAGTLQGQTPTSAYLAVSMTGYLRSQRMLKELKRILSAALEAPHVDDHWQLSFELLTNKGHLDFTQGKFNSAIENYTNARRLLPETEPQQHARMTRNISLCYRHTGHLTHALKELVDLEKRSEGTSVELSKELKLRVSNQAGEILNALGRFRESDRHYRESLNFLPRRAKSIDRALAIANMAENLIDLGELDEAERLLNESTSIQRDIGWNFPIVHCAYYLLEIHSARRDKVAARDLTLELLNISPEGRGDHMAATRLLGISLGLLTSGDATSAIRSYEEALDTCRKISLKTSEIDSLLGLANALNETRDAERALQVSIEAHKISHKTSHQAHVARSLQSQAESLLQIRKVKDSYATASAAVTLHRDCGSKLELARSLRTLGTAAAALGKTCHANESWTESSLLFSSMNIPGANELRALIEENR
ncbi:BTAD domain-containing putative transcriptional regulator [Allokutzneria sp. NRRL B-24872]|uniref:AfsR/SARP family transcriptional regulator n=1 Tax=Allokutzneria sp. NRRL B-24872 TaxID=1137961 RepID=UPI000A381972|nr:BTAD domain-containing putative transcriptional regulator [Allokutzneria sp. NRRL B-24872]